MNNPLHSTTLKSPIKTLLSQHVAKALHQGLHVTLVKDEESFLCLESEWDNLLTNSQANNIFLTWEWVNTWWKVYKQDFELYLIVVRDKEANLVGIGPFKLARKRFLQLCNISVLEFLGSGVGATPELLEEKGWLSNYSMISGGEMLAGMYCLKYDGNHYYYQSGRTTKYPKYHLGYVLVNHILGDAIAEGSNTFSFLTGDEAYKFHWADSCQYSSRIISLTKGKAGLWPKFYFMCTTAATALRRKDPTPS
jgi:CelD/BcsL family acetyltransferase involved in cellulose biosynthesis